MIQFLITKLNFKLIYNYRLQTTTLYVENIIKFSKLKQFVNSLKQYFRFIFQFNGYNLFLACMYENKFLNNITISYLSLNKIMLVYYIVICIYNLLQTFTKYVLYKQDLLRNISIQNINTNLECFDNTKSFYAFIKINFQVKPIIYTILYLL